jgi:hypothetical protein
MSTGRPLAAADAELVAAQFGDGCERRVGAGIAASDQLVDEATGRAAGAGDERGADAVTVDRSRREAGQRVLVEVARDDDPRVLGAELVELAANGPRQVRQVARVDADRAELRTGDLDPDPDRFADVVRVDQQRRPGAEGVDLGGERLPLRVV